MLFEMPLRSQRSWTRCIAPRRLIKSGASTPLCLRFTPRRLISANDKPLPENDNASKGPNQAQLPHVSEEAGATSEIMGEATKPEAEEQGTPVQEVLKRDGAEAKEKAPKVIQQGMDNLRKGSRSYSTSTRRRAELRMSPQPADDMIMNYQQTGEGLINRQSMNLGKEGHIFGLPALPLPRNMHIKQREDPVVDQATKLLMTHGKLSKAQRTMTMILERLRTASPPQYDSRRPLVPGAPPASHLPLDPVLYMTLAIDSVAPLFRIRSQKGAAGGGMALQIPAPLNLRQRRRTSIAWIINAASKKNSKGSGKSMFAHKVADELISIINGGSSLWEKRQGIHKLGVASRANLAGGKRKKRRKV